MTTLAARIRQLRIESNLTQADFGKIFGIVKSTVSLYENNKSTPDDEIKKKIAKHFNVSLDFLMGNSDIKKPYDSAISYKNDIAKDLENTLDQIKGAQDSLRFDGEILDDDARELLKIGLKSLIRLGKQIVKKDNNKKVL